MLRVTYHISIVLACALQIGHFLHESAISLINVICKGTKIKSIRLRSCRYRKPTDRITLLSTLKSCLIMGVKYTSLHSLAYHFKLLFPYSKSLKKESRSIVVVEFLNKLVRRTTSLSPLKLIWEWSSPRYPHRLFISVCLTQVANFTQAVSRL